MHRNLMTLIVGAGALALAPSLAHADPRDGRRRTVYVYDGHDTYRVNHPRRIVRRVLGEPKRTTHHPTPQPVYAPPAPPAYRTLPLLPEHRASQISQQLQRYRNHPRTQLRVLADWTRGYQVTLEQILCLTQQVCASTDRATALVQLYPQLDGRCCLDYVARTQHLLTPCDREAYACQIAALRPACAHGPAQVSHGHTAPARPRPARTAPAPQRVVVERGRRGRR